MIQTGRTVSPMSNEARNSYVISHITEAMLILLADRPLSDISISALCERAGVGRASFYRNFENKEAVLRGYIDELFHEWTDGYANPDVVSLNEQIRAIFAHFEKHRRFYKLLNERKLTYLLKDVLIGIYGPGPECEKTEAYAAAFVTYSLYGWIEVWFQRGMRESAEEMAALFKGQGL